MSKDGKCQCKKSAQANGLNRDASVCEVCSKYVSYTIEEKINLREGREDSIDSFGFHVRGDAPVIISHVEINSLADVCIKHNHFYFLVAKKNRIYIFYYLAWWNQRG